MSHRFLGQVNEAFQHPGKRIGAIALTWGSFLVLGQIPVIILLMVIMANDPKAVEAFQENPDDFSQLGISKLLLFSVIMTQFVIGMTGLVLSTMLIMKQAFRTIWTAFARIRWVRILQALLVWTLLMGAYGLLLHFRDPHLLKPQALPPDYVIWVVVSLLLIPIQSAFEELAIRGQMMQLLYARALSPLLPVIITSVFFAALHLMNQEVVTYGTGTMMLHYFTFGLFLGILAVVDDGLELPIGLHIANNLFAFLVIGYPAASLDTPVLFLQQHMEPGQEYLAFWGMALIFYAVFYLKKPEAIQKLWAQRKMEENEES